MSEPAAGGESLSERKATRGGPTSERKAVRGDPDGKRNGARDAGGRVKPRLRGVTHEYAFFVALVAGVLLILAASGARATVATSIYAAAITGLFGVSALYHRIDWSHAVH